MTNVAVRGGMGKGKIFDGKLHSINTDIFQGGESLQ